MPLRGSIECRPSVEVLARAIDLRSDDGQHAVARKLRGKVTRRRSLSPRQFGAGDEGAVEFEEGGSPDAAVLGFDKACRNKVGDDLPLQAKLLRDLLNRRSASRN